MAWLHFWEFFARRCTTTGAGASSLELQSIFVRQSTAALNEFPLFLARAVYAWNYGTLFPPGFVSGSYTSCVWVLHEEYHSVFFRAMLGSTVNTCSASV